MKKFIVFMFGFCMGWFINFGVIFIPYFILSFFVNFTFIENFLYCKMYVLILVLTFLQTSYKMIANSNEVKNHLKSVE